jgi:hypothetical protein
LLNPGQNNFGKERMEEMITDAKAVQNIAENRCFDPSGSLCRKLDCSACKIEFLTKRFLAPKQEIITAVQQYEEAVDIWDKLIRTLLPIDSEQVLPMSYYQKVETRKRLDEIIAKYKEGGEADVTAGEIPAKQNPLVG